MRLVHEPRQRNKAERRSHFALTPSCSIWTCGATLTCHSADIRSIMQGIGEMSAYLPVPGGHMTYAGRFVDPALSFAITWSYAIQWMLVCPAE